MAISDSANNTLRFDWIRVENFRCFAECEFDLHPQMTVFVADNGKGKTALLDGIGMLLESFMSSIVVDYAVSGIKTKDIRLGTAANGNIEACLPTVAAAKAVVFGLNTEWERRRTSASRRNSEKDQKAAQLTGAVAVMNDDSQSDNISFPVVASYEATRTAIIPDGKDIGTSLSISPHRLTGYEDCFRPIGSFSRFVEWYKATSESIENKSVHSKTVNYVRLLNCVNEAVELVLSPTEWTKLQWNYEGDFLQILSKDGRILPAAAMSDGVRTTLAIVADLAHRCCRLNPHLGHEARINTPGVVLIDEVDIHLHPGWQQQIADLFRDAFPLIQFVVTTHSPQVLSTLDNECIRVIHVDDGIGEIRTPAFQTRGVESAEVLAEIMGIDPVPPVPEATMLRKFRSLIEDRKSETEEAIQLAEELNSHFGSQHPVMKECERLERFFAFKEKRKDGDKK